MANNIDSCLFKTTSETSLCAKDVKIFKQETPLNIMASPIAPYRYKPVSATQLQQYYTKGNTITKRLRANNPTVVIILSYTENTVSADVNAYSALNEIVPMNIPDKNGNLVITNPDYGNLTIYYQNSGGNSVSYSTNPAVVAYPHQTGSFAMEVSLDVQAVHAQAPFADIVLVYAPKTIPVMLASAVRFSQNVLTSIYNIVAVSMSWGGGEGPEMQKVFGNLFTNPNLLFFASSGDSGSQPQQNYPACHPNVIGCGATSLVLLPDGSLTELGCTIAGGGVTKTIAKPLYQKDLPYERRCVPDISMNGDPYTGIRIITNGVNSGGAIGGTSLSTPLAAAVVAVLIQQYMLNKNITKRVCIRTPDFFKYLYTPNGQFDVITDGTSLKWTNIMHCNNGYDFVTGLGSIVFDHVLNNCKFTVL